METVYAAKARAAKLKEERDEAERKLAAANVTIKKLTDRLEVTNPVGNTEPGYDYKAMMDRIKSQDAALQEKNSQLSSTRSSNESLSRRLDEATIELKAANKEVARLAGDTNSETLKEVEQDRDAANKLVEVLSKQQRTLQAQYDQVSRELATVNEERNTLLAEVKKLTAKEGDPNGG